MYLFSKKGPVFTGFYPFVSTTWVDNTEEVWKVRVSETTEGDDTYSYWGAICEGEDQFSMIRYNKVVFGLCFPSADADNVGDDVTIHKLKVDVIEKIR